jgi:hypothetical protein
VSARRRGWWIIALWACEAALGWLLMAWLVVGPLVLL